MTPFASLAATLGIVGFIRGDELRAKCPLHSDNNPSFSLNISTGLWQCFSGCGSGQFTNLVEQILGCGFQEARDWVDTNGRQTSAEQLSKRLALELGQKEEFEKAVENTEWRNKYNLLKNNVMPLWFLKRGFTWETIWAWGIKYDPALDAVTIPVRWNNEIVGTVTRHIKEGYPKYQNSPNLPRSEILFGLSFINANKSFIILTEGCLDTLWGWQCGFPTVGLLGTFLSDKQIGILKDRRFGEIILALDNDEAGYKGTVEAINRLTKAGYLLPQISVVKFPDGIKDFQDCYLEELEELVKNRKGVLNL